MKLQPLLAAIAVVIPLLSVFLQVIADLDYDRQALLDFAGSVPHIRKLNWNLTLPICKSWAGITCNEDGTRVIAIHLPAVGLFGPIPANSIGKLDALKVLSLRANYLNGSIPSDLLSIPSLQSVYLQHNSFSGNIPVSLSPRLGVLDLSFNSFTGEIPPTIKNLTRLSVLNLQFNSLTGEIPSLDTFRLNNLNLSYNMLNGSVPYPLQKFPISSFVGNSHLCGTPLASCSLSPSPSPPADALSPPAIPEKHKAVHSKKLSTGIIIGIAVVAAIVMFLLVLVFSFCCLKKKVSHNTSIIKEKVANVGRSEKPEDFGSGVPDAEKNKLVFFEGCSYSFNLEDLLRASAEVLGKGSYGTAYKAVLDEATIVVIKRLREVGVAKKEFEQHMEIIGRVGRHANIVPLRGYYYSKDEKLLINEYMPAGSLSAALHGNRGIGRTPLDWDARLKIALGAAKGIAHIHTEGGVKFTHGNVKSSNVLLTRDLDGCISDFGLTPLMNYISYKYRCAGYRAAEVIETRKGTQKSDVYSFGVLLLEMLTGKYIPAPYGYKNPFKWPLSRDLAWYANVPHKELTVEKAVQNWIRFEGDRFRFPGGGTMFPNGADAYIDDIGKLINLKDGSIRTAIDTGCGVASWGAYLLSRNILAISFAPRDTHEAQVQFALERGVPALIGVIASKRLPYPSRAFDMAHCSRCLIPWGEYDGTYLIEVDRVLRPGGYWILSGPPIHWRKYWKGWERTKEDLNAEQTKIEKVARSLCWKKFVEKDDIAIWQKPYNHLHCKKLRKASKNPPMCPPQDPDRAWYTENETCLTSLPEVSSEGMVAGGQLEKWPKRLHAIPPRISRGTVNGVTADTFNKDTQLWIRRVSYYKTVNNQLDQPGRYRNLLDMNAYLGGFAANLIDDPVWVMNIVPAEAKVNTLGVIYERGLIGTYQSWCEAMSTYPRTYDLIHADSVFTLYEDRCETEDILLEMDRILRPEGSVIIRDDVDRLIKVKRITDGLNWDSQIVDHEDGPLEREKLLFAVKTYWTAPSIQES